MGSAKVAHLSHFVPRLEREDTMYFEAVETNRTKLWIINSMLELLWRKEYADITINMIADNAGLGRRTFYRHFETKDDAMKHITELLMDEFASNIVADDAHDMEGILTAYFVFWEQYIDVLLLMKKAHLLYFIEDDLPALILRVAQKVKHVPEDIPPETIRAEYEQYKYAFTIKLSSLWKATMVWCEDSPRKSPQEMAQVIVSLIR